MYLMDSATLSSRIGFGVAFLELTISLVLCAYALYLWNKTKKKRVADLLICNLGCTGVLYISWSIVNYSLHIYWRLDTETKIHVTGQAILGHSYYQTVLCITIDRIQAVRLTYRYRVVMRKRVFLFMLVYIWSISCSAGIFYYFTSKRALVISWAFWDCLVAMVIVIGYSYIIIAVRRQKRRVSANTASVLSPQFKYRIPLLISVTFILFFCITDWVILVHQEFYSIWIVVIWYLNLICDPLTYVVFTKKQNIKRSISS